MPSCHQWRAGLASAQGCPRRQQRGDPGLWPAREHPCGPWCWLCAQEQIPCRRALQGGCSGWKSSWCVCGAWLQWAELGAQEGARSGKERAVGCWIM